VNNSHDHGEQQPPHLILSTEQPQHFYEEEKLCACWVWSYWSNPGFRALKVEDSRGGRGNARLWQMMAQSGSLSTDDENPCYWVANGTRCECPDGWTTSGDFVFGSTSPCVVHVQTLHWLHVFGALVIALSFVYTLVRVLSRARLEWSHSRTRLQRAAHCRSSCCCASGVRLLLALGSYPLRSLLLAAICQYFLLHWAIDWMVRNLGIGESEVRVFVGLFVFSALYRTAAALYETIATCFVAIHAS